MSSYYRLLGIPRNADLDEIRHAYWSLSSRIRRERSTGPGESQLSQIQRAYETLSDSARRRAYDDRRLGVGRVELRRYNGSGHVPRESEEDVAIDFPSMSTMAGIVPQIYEAFFGLEPATHTSHVELTPREASAGVRLPLEIPVRPVCPLCGGRGETWSEPCGVCCGTGSGLLSHRIELPVPPGVRHGTRLTFSVTPPFASEAQIELRIAIQ